MNRKEAEYFENIFIEGGIFEQIDPELDAEDIVRSYECLPLPEAIEKLTQSIIRGLEHKMQSNGYRYIIN